MSPNNPKEKEKKVRKECYIFPAKKQLFSFMSYLCNVDGCESCGRVVPTGGPSVLSLLLSIRSSCREDRGRSQLQWDEISEPKERWPWKFKDKIGTQINADERYGSVELIKVLVVHNHFQIKFYKASFWWRLFYTDSGLLNMLQQTICFKETCCTFWVLTDFKDLLPYLLLPWVVKASAHCSEVQDSPSWFKWTVESKYLRWIIFHKQKTKAFT